VTPFEETIHSHFRKYKKMYIKDRAVFVWELAKENPTKFYEIFEEYLEEHGEGDNLIVINNIDRAHIALSNYDSFLDYHKKMWEFHHNMFEDLGETSEEVYEFDPEEEWFHWMDGDRVIHGTLCSVRNYLKRIYLEEFFRYIHQEIPHSCEYKTVRKTATQEEDVLIYDADGREQELIYLCAEVMVFYNVALSDSIDSLGPFDTLYHFSEWDNEEWVLIPNQEVGSEIDFESFLPSVGALAGDTQDLKDLVEDARKAFQGILREIHEEVQNDFNSDGNPVI